MYVVMKIWCEGLENWFDKNIILWEHVKVYDKSVKVEIKSENFKIIFVWGQKHILYLNKVGCVQKAVMVTIEQYFGKTLLIP
jgi:hypothetical protein